MRAGKTNAIPIGFSFTTLLFGFVPSVFRGHWTFALRCLAFDLLALAAIIVASELGADVGAAAIAFAPFAFRFPLVLQRNDALEQWLKEDGWEDYEPVDYLTRYLQDYED